MISISALIYKSTSFADLCYEKIMEHTPMIKEGKARFFFVANDATDKVKKHLIDKGYPHVIQDNPVHSDDTLFNMGIGAPEYINRVYRGWNRAILEGDEWVVLLNSDMFPSPGWLEGLLKDASEDKFLCAGMVERDHPRYRTVIPGAFHGECGHSVETYDEKKFLGIAAELKKTRGGTLHPGGAFMPCMFKREMALLAGLYPEGNVHRGRYTRIICGDLKFTQKLHDIGVKHYTTWDSAVYHFKEGEMDE